MNVTKVTNVTKVLVTFSLSDIVVTFLVTVVTFQKVVYSVSFASCECRLGVLVELAARFPTRHRLHLVRLSTASSRPRRGADRSGSGSRTPRGGDAPLAPRPQPLCWCSLLSFCLLLIPVRPYQLTLTLQI